MIKSLAALLSPDLDYYRSMGELARTLQHFLSTAHKYRDKGRWGSNGPSEDLCNYGGCVNSYDQVWHSGRISSTNPGHSEVTTWQQNHDAIYDCILAALCNEYPAATRWRKEHGVELGMRLKFPMAYQNQKDEQEAWKAVMALHCYKLPVQSLNPCHRNVNVLAAPELIIGRESISLKVCVTQRTEMRTSPQCYSRWDVCSLLHDYGSRTGTPRPKWNPRREDFAVFLLRAVEFYKAVQPSPERFKREGKAILVNEASQRTQRAQS